MNNFYRINFNFKPFTHNRLQFALHFLFFNHFRDLRETRQRYDSVGGEIKRKDNQIRELQQRLESNEGCKLISIYFSLF